jgi:hypothetical protein
MANALFISPIICRHFYLLAWQHCFYFIIASELQRIKNILNFQEKNIHESLIFTQSKKQEKKN